MKKRNVTITLDDDTARWARVEAARQDISVSRFLGDMLTERRLAERGYELARRRYLSRDPQALRTSGKLPSRDDVHERHGIR